MADIFTDSELDAIVEGTAPTQKGAPTYVAPDLDDPKQLDQVVDGQFSSPGKYKNPWTAPFELLRDSYQVGEVPVVRGAKGTELMFNTEISDEEETAQRSGLEKPHLEALSKDVDLMKTKLGGWNFWTFASDAANIAPSMVETGKGSLVGGGIGAGAGAGAALVAGQLGPQVAVPEELLTVPGGAALGFRWGATTGGVVAGAQMNMGNVYLDLREKGISRGNARTFAVASGTVMGAMEYFGLRQLSGVARKAFAKQLQTPAGKAAVAGMVKKFQESGMFGRILEGAGSETATEVGQEITQLTTEALAVWAETGEEVWNNPKFWEEAQARISQTAIQTARGSLLLAGGGEVTGTAAGKATKSFQSMIREAQMQDAQASATLAGRGWQAVKSGQVSWREAFDAVKMAFTEEGQAKLENAKEEEVLEDMSDDDVLDMLRDPATGETELDATEGGPTQEQIAAAEGAIQELAQSPEGQQVLQAAIQFTEGQDREGDAALEGTPFGDLLAPEVVPAEEMDEEWWNAETPGEIIDFTPDEGKQEFDFDADEEAAATGGLTAVEAQARVNQINTDIRTLTQKQKKLEAEAETKMEKGYKVEALLDRVEKILSKKEELELEKELLGAGLLSREEVAERRGQQRISVLSNLVGRIQNSADRLSRTRKAYQFKLANQKAAFDAKVGNLKTKAQQQAAKAAQKAYKSGQYTEQKTIRSLQAQLIQVINAATTDKNFRQRLKTMVNKVSNRKQFNTAAKNIQKELAKLQKKKADAQYKKAREKVIAQVERAIKDRTRSAGRGNPTVGSLDADTVKRLKTFRDYLSDQNAAQTAIQDFLNNYATQLQQRQLHLIPAEDLENFEIARMAFELEKQDLFTLNVIAANVAQWLDDGRNAILQKKAALAQQRQDERNVAYQSVGVDPDEVKKAKSISKRKKRPVKQWKASTLTWNTLLDWMTPKDPNHALTEMMDVTQARDEYLAGKELSTLAFKQKLDAALKAAGSTKNINQKIYEDSHKTVTFEYTDQHGTTISLEIDRAQLLEAWMKMQDTSLHASMRDTDKGNGWTLKGDVPAGQSFQEAVESLLTTEDLAVGQAMLDFYQDYHARFNQPYREKYGVDLPMRDNYSPVSRKGYAVDPGNSLEFGSLLPGAAISRQNTLLRVELQNPYTSLENHVAQVERFIAFDSLTGTMRNVFGDSNVRETIKERYGAGTVEVVDDYIERFVQNRTTNWAQSDSLISALMSDLSLSALTFKSIHQFLTQMTSLTAMYANYSPVDVAKGWISYIQNAKQTEATLRSSPTLAHRFKSGASYEFNLATRKNSIGLNFISALLDKDPPSLPPKAYQMVSNLMYGFMRLGDAGVARAGGGPIYHIELANGKTPEAALMQVNRLMEQTQQGDDPSQMPSLYANSQYAYLFGGMFALQPIQLLGLAQTKINDFANNPSSKNAVKAAGQIAALWLIPGFTYGLVRNIPLWLAPPEDDDDLKKEFWMDMLVSTLLGPANAMPLIGDVIERAWWASASFITGEDAPQWTKGGRDNPIAQLYSDPEKAIQAWMKLSEQDDGGLILEVDEDEEAEKQQKALAKTIKAASRWGGVSNALLNMPGGVVQSLQQGDYIGAIMAISGASPAKLQQRLKAGRADEADVMIQDEEDDKPFSLFGDNSDVDAQLEQEFPTEDKENDDPAFTESEMGDILDDELESR